MQPYELFEILAGKTWKSIERCGRNRIHLGEDAITTGNLDALASAPSSCIVIEDTRSTESTKGCDFELWIGTDHVGWTRYAIQAKKIQLATGRYSSLNHKVGSAKILQIDILEKYSKANKAVPIYAFYNHSSESFKWNCNLPSEVDQLGVSVTPSSVVRVAINKPGCRSFFYVHNRPETIPWRCLVKCPHLIGKGKVGKPGWAPISDGFHQRLPATLSQFRERSAAISFLDQHGLFNNDSELRPEWIGIIDVGIDAELR